MSLNKNNKKPTGSDCLGNIHVLCNHKKGRKGSLGQKMAIFERERRAVRKPPNHDYVIHTWMIPLYPIINFNKPMLITL